MLALIQTGLSCSCLLLGSYCPAVNTCQVFSNLTSFSGPVSFDLFSALIVDLQRQRLSLLLRISIYRVSCQWNTCAHNFPYIGYHVSGILGIMDQERKYLYHSTLFGNQYSNLKKAFSALLSYPRIGKCGRGQESFMRRIEGIPCKGERNGFLRCLLLNCFPLCPDRNKISLRQEPSPLIARNPSYSLPRYYTGFLGTILAFKLTIHSCSSGPIEDPYFDDSKTPTG